MKFKSFCTEALTAVLLLQSALVFAQADAMPSPAGTSQTLDRVVAIVDEDEILFRELQAAVDRVAMNAKRAARELPPDEQFRRQVFHQRVIERLQLQLVKRAGPRVRVAELNDEPLRVAQQSGTPLAK